ncbi:MAG TPA: signal recognition particle protein [Anaerolineales bacterium]|nr:signal recognition particle protein [Anaerolineales bacterium]
MFRTLSDKLQTVFQNLTRRGKLNEADVDAALREVRLALLEADVNFTVVRDFLARVRARAVGAEVSRALNPGQQVIKIVHEELIATLGEPGKLNLSGQPPRTIMLVGLQGAGKTTMAAKLARWLRAQGHKPMLVAADPYRPAAVDQLQTLGAQIDVPVFSGPDAPPDLCHKAVEHAADIGYTAVILDTAGRLQIDPTMMGEVAAIKERTSPSEVLLVADAMTGQEAVRIADGFNKQVGLTGLILTKVDGDARGGAAISMRSITGVPIKFLGVSEKIDGIEAFAPERLSGRILGMGDMLGLIEKAEAAFTAKEAQKAQEKLVSGEFTLEDFRDQLRQVKKMGPLGQIMEMVPGMGKIAGQIDQSQMDKGLVRLEAIIDSMTPRERHNPQMLNASRKRRVAAGSGTSVQEINQLVKQFREMQKMMKQLGNMKGRGGLQNVFRGFR